MQRWMVAVSALAIVLLGVWWSLRDSLRSSAAASRSAASVDPDEPVAAKVAPSAARAPAATPAVTPDAGPAASEAGSEVATLGAAFSARYDSVRAEVETYDRVLRESGPSAEPWTVDARLVMKATVDEIAGKAAGAGDRVVQASAPECYRLGCIVHLIHASAGAMDSFEDEYRASRRAWDWPNGRLLTAAYDDQGAVKNSLIFVRPQ